MGSYDSELRTYATLGAVYEVWLGNARGLKENRYRPLWQRASESIQFPRRGCPATFQWSDTVRRGPTDRRVYGTAKFDSHVEPLAITEGDGGQVRVRVHQLVKNLEGNVLSDGEVLHVFTVNSGLIAAMDLGVRPIQLLVRLMRSHIDPNWVPAVERESRNQARESTTGSKPHS